MNIKQLKIQNVKNSSGIFNGDNLQQNWKHTKKDNEGFGSLLGSSNKASRNSFVVKKDLNPNEGG